MAIVPDLSKVLGNSGFRAVADAVRLATVTAQFLNANHRDHRPVRYDLFPDLRRKRELPGNVPFIEAVSEFVQSYNSENARQAEILKGNPERRTWRPSPQVTTEQFAAFVSLVESFGRSGASTIGAMLCAYGSCREPRDADAPDGAEQSQPRIGEDK